jgi:dihydrolipoamide dehydrogenase
MVVGDISTGTDVLVIGGGPGGYVAAIRAGQLNLDVTLVEADAYGGTCLNYGCIPSKAMVTASDIANDARNAEHIGVHADPEVDLEEMVGWKDDVINQLTGGVKELCKANGVNLVEGWAEFTDGQGSETIEFEHCIIASGSRPIEIPSFEFDGENVLSSRDVLALESVPDSLVVVGGGYIGMELSMVLAKLGTKVTILEMLDEVMGNYGPDITRVVRKHAEELGIEIHVGQAAKKWSSSEGGITVQAEAEDGTVSGFDAEKCLLAVGREPVTDSLNIDTIELQPDDRGFLSTDDRARTELNHIFAVGDVAGEPMLAHKASKEGEVAAEVIAGEPSALDYQAIPAAVFTEPEIGTVGLTETEATNAGFDPVVGRMPLRASGRALTLDDTTGFVRIITDEATGFILGAQIVAPGASELIAEIGLAIEMGASLEDITCTIHTHPTLSEAVMEAAANARGESTHTVN